MGGTQLELVLVGKAIARAWQNKRITQEVLSSLSDIGRTHLSAVERGQRKPTLETLWRSAYALDMSPGALVDLIERYVNTSTT